VAEESEERGNSESFVAFRDDLEVYGMPVKPEAEERGGGIDRDHKKDTNYAERGQSGEQKVETGGVLSLLSWICVVEGVHPYQVEREEDGYQGACC
jgi:hypothetical protein